MYPPHTKKLDWLFTAASSWFVGGFFVDGWAHHHLVSSLETFFTPWHALFYSGFGVTAGFLAIVAWKNMKAGYDLRHSLPRGYGLALIGACFFAVGGALDMLWHIVFGIEANIEALISPMHLILMTGMTMMLAAPFRSLWYRSNVDANFAAQLPFLISLTFTVMIISFITQILNMVVYPWMLWQNKTADEFFAYALGIGNVILQPAIFMGAMLLLMRRIRLGLGAFTLMFTVMTLGFAFMEDHFQFILYAFFAGLIADGIVAALSRGRLQYQFRMIAFTAPALLTLSQFIAVFVGGSMWWSTHMWMGAIVLSGITGLLISYLIMPPVEFEEDRNYSTKPL